MGAVVIIDQCLLELRQARVLAHDQGILNLPTWQGASEGAKPPKMTESDAGEWRRGWQFYICSNFENTFSERVILPASNTFRRAMLLSQSGPQGSKWLSVIPGHVDTILKPIRMQVALRRRLRWPLPLGPRVCNGNSCKQELDRFGDHWASCMRSGMRSLGFVCEVSSECPTALSGFQGLLLVSE